MSWIPAHLGPYPDDTSLDAQWCDTVRAFGGRASIAGESVEGRPIRRFDLGPRSGRTILLTALIHGIELVSSLALLEVVRSLRRETLPRDVRLVVLPMVNPDALAENSARLRRGSIAFQRCNARGVDLNRNFPLQTSERSWHPFAGSRFRVSPHHMGPHAFSEPETRAVRDVVRDVRPFLSLGFHSFGNMLLHPWAYTSAPAPRVVAYRRLGAAFLQGLRGPRYDVRQARDFYPVMGDMDDWLDAEHGTLAFTVEVSKLDARLLSPRRLVNPFCWMNPTRVEETVRDLAPGVLALMREAAIAPVAAVIEESDVSLAAAE